MTEDTEFELKNREKDKELKRKQKRISFWVKDITVFIVALVIILIIDFYSFTIFQKGSASEGEMRFAIAALSSTVIGLLSYMVGRASK
ncbi:hypothetical protein H6S82_06500 [Planktothrix sp. FACHB-1355]|uniref:Uncharacterized protein n=1 Tax=Aerosakkonema funiforme FACHB-1375 TaxID=2949571 RepID=A0A926VHR8_9CYAN|nr:MULTISPECIES: hypothetical protein [Oscillatoriales]MBD2184141.1 hypothetical protein [Aerosakkonema funiforme FACHB-1375]MBD3558505.1 hypothetical protein [Planktothrix sp. FACHB-1355]